MVRLEKILYEQIVNSKQFKRERIFGRPRKWYNEPRTPVMRYAAVRLYTQGLTAQLFRLVEPIVAKFTYQWQRDYMLQRGLAMEDLVVFQDRELRRDPLFEHIMRESYHPMTWILFNKRRARFYKCERSVRGAYAPDWLRQEAEQRTLAESIENKDEFDRFVYQNYMSDMTPTVRPSALQKFIIFEFLQIFGIFRPEAWDRFFYNEVFYYNNTYIEKDDNYLANPFAQHNLQTDEGRRNFEVDVKRFIDLYPGSIVKPGELFDFKRFYALEALRSGKDTTSFDPELIAQLRSKIEQNPQVATKKDRKKKLASILPEWLAPDQGKGILSS